jgi:hypothetical protein
MSTPLVCVCLYNRDGMFLCYTYRAFSYIQYIDQQMHIIKYIEWARRNVFTALYEMSLYVIQVNFSL